MRNFLKISLTAIALMLLFNTFAVTETNAQRTPVAEALKRMDDHNKALTSLKASIAMVKYDATLEVTEESDKYSGKLIYYPQKKGNTYLRIDWTKPREESLAVIGKQYMLYQPKLQQAYTGNVDQAKGSGKANSALAFLNMSKAQIQENYTVTYSGQENVNGNIGTWHLVLTPKTKSNYKVADVWVDKDGMPVMAKLTATNNDTTTVLLSDIKKNESVDGSAFAINPPKGTKIIKS